MINIQWTFNNCEKEAHKFEHVAEKLSYRPDLHAFLLLDRLVPNPGVDIVGDAHHDVIYLNVDCEELAKVATEEDIRDLRRCGVWYDEDYECLGMFV